MIANAKNNLKYQPLNQTTSMNSENPPPLPQPNQKNPAIPVNPQDRANQKPAGKPLAITSILIACAGILPLIVFFFACISARDWAGRPMLGFGHFAFFFLGFIIHGVGLGLGFVAAFFMNQKSLGLIGGIGNAAIIFFAILSLLLGLANI
jgi:hypothetical protein